MSQLEWSQSSEQTLHIIMTGALFKLPGAALKGVNIKTIALETFVHTHIVVGFLEIGFSILKRLKKHWWP